MAKGVLLFALVCLFLLRWMMAEQCYETIKMIPENSTVTVSGMIYKKEFKKEGYVYYLKDAVICLQSEAVDIRKETEQDGRDMVEADGIMIKVPQDTCQIGDRITIITQMRWMNEARNPGGFDERAYYHSLGIATVLYCDENPLRLGPSKWCPLRNGLFTLRRELRQVYEEQLNEKDAGILSSMVLGDKSLMEEELKQLYSSAGISHILAVSGLHVSLIGRTCYQFLRRRRKGYLTSCLLSGVVLMLFCLMSGMSVSALRAGMMFLVFLGAEFLGRKYNSLRAMALAAGISLLITPGYITNAGFWFSYLAVFGAVCVGQPFQMKEKHWYQGLVNSLVLSGSVLVTTLPLTAFFFYEIPLYSMLANLIVIPLAGIVMGFGLLGGFLSLTGLPGVWVSFFPCHVVLRLYEWVCNLLSHLPMDQWITGKPSLWGMFLYYGILAVLIWAYRTRGEVGKGWTGLRIRTLCRIGYRVRGRLVWIVPLICMVLMFTRPTPQQYQMTFLDVGQGDGIYLNGGDGRTYFVDGGSTSEKELGRYTILPYLKSQRVRNVDVWFVSHADTDHISGLLQVLERGYPVGTVVLSEYSSFDDENVALLQAAAALNGTQVVTASNLDCIIGNGYTLTCYTPEAAGEDRNEASLILLAEREGCDALFTGDIGTEQEKWLLTQPGIGEVEVLKVAHHGSRYSSGAEFLSAISPHLSVISVGRNTYGHPSPEVLERLEAADSKVVQTIESGAVTFLEKKEGFYLTEYKK